MADGRAAAKGGKLRVDIGVFFTIAGQAAEVLDNCNRRWHIFSNLFCHGFYLSRFCPARYSHLERAHLTYLKHLVEGTSVDKMFDYENGLPNVLRKLLENPNFEIELFSDVLKDGDLSDVRVYELDIEQFYAQLFKTFPIVVQTSLNGKEETRFGFWYELKHLVPLDTRPFVRMVGMPVEQTRAIFAMGADQRASINTTRQRTGPGPLEILSGRGESPATSRRPATEARLTERRLDSVTTASRTYVQSGTRGSTNDADRIQSRGGDPRGAESTNGRSDHENAPCERHSHLQAPCGCCLGHGIPARPPDCSACGSGSQKEQSKIDFCRDKLRKTWLNKRQKDATEESLNKRAVTTLRTPPNATPAPLSDLDVDELVRRIEGTSVAVTADPKKAAKKARQKEKKIQLKEEEDKQRELEEKLKKEEEERILREKIEREAEELRLAEEHKRLARKAKKKNKKQRAAAAAASLTTPNNNESSLENLDKHVQSKVNANGTVTLTLNPKLKHMGGETSAPFNPCEAPATPVSEAPLTGMVTIRRCSSKENLVTITSATCGGKKENLLYYLLDGQLYSYDAKKKNANDITCQSTSTCVVEPDGKKKKKKNSKSGKPNELPKENFVTITATQTFGARSQSSPVESSLTALRNYGHLPSKSVAQEIVDIDSIILPPGITITKVEPGNSDENKSVSNSPLTSDKSPNRKSQNSIENPPSHTVKLGDNEVVVSTVRKTQTADSELHYIPPDDMDLFGPKETEEFEEVVSQKTRKNRLRAAKVKERENTTIVSEETDSVRSSPSRSSLTSRCTPPFIDRSTESGPKRCGPGKPSPGLKCTKPLKPAVRSSNTGNSTVGGYPKNSNEKLVPTTKRDGIYQKPNENYMRSPNSLKVMPRLSRPEATNADFSNTTSSTKENYDPFGNQLINRSHILSSQTQPISSNHDGERYKALVESNSEIFNVKSQLIESGGGTVGIQSNGARRREHISISTLNHGDREDLSHQSFTNSNHREALSTTGQPQTLQTDGALHSPKLNQLSMSKPTDQSWSPWGGSGVWTHSPNPGSSPSPRFGVSAYGVEEPVNDRKTVDNLFGQTVGVPIQRPTPASSADLNVDSYAVSDNVLSVGLVPSNGESLLQANQYFGQSSTAINNITNGLEDLQLDQYNPNARLNVVLQNNESSVCSNVHRSSSAPDNPFTELDQQVNAIHRPNPWDGEANNDPPAHDWNYSTKYWGSSNFSKLNSPQVKPAGSSGYGVNRTGMAPQVMPKDSPEWFNFPNSNTSPTLEQPSSEPSYGNMQQQMNANTSQYSNATARGLQLFPDGMNCNLWGQNHPSHSVQTTPYVHAQRVADDNDAPNVDFRYLQGVNNRMQGPDVSIQLVNNSPVYGHALGPNLDYSGGSRH